MSTATVNIPTPGQPPVVPLPSAHLACRSCGVAAPTDGEVIRVSLGHHWGRVPGGDAASQRAVTDWLDLGICERCTTIRGRAASLVDQHRSLQRDLGGVAFDRVHGALLALDVLGADPGALRSAASVLQLVGIVHGAGVAFEALQRPGVCASARWSHVEDDARRALRDAAARWMRTRTALPAEQLGPPVDSALRACAYCGVDRADVWEAVVVSTRALGGAPTPGYLEADLCGPCADAVQAVGSVGRSSMVRALFAYLGIPRRNLDEVVEVKMVGFGALPAGTRPNTEPWGHVDVPALRSDLRAVGIS
ncbi:MULTISPECIES: hypothetical protein [unclassified Microbacterium]|uniref:hypothetical protein n=1 Tax=unclassified Microbacterium TaxID=2609290 RepID=UPI0024688FC0|nr:MULTISPECIES: hypothetical protein [unclassified Microbacterium]MDH5134619.1 hypothetical protein [Microbacterium sp. RD10]MDH5138173.1 hypothetical protein [Microbacterium sp. RD11]MDH5146107.1 hypothetical protein [Microbacterium sp. RD12]MDH5156156.1 hypothetical protein [Microbacterium sp. RD06]MDH5168100.1 hypothetical protein [Microbacterium sp. RD02]